jgi:2-dehydro-3-deoxyphosphogluconate aldolase / (4S)-4-hydroxy-2-oxoglutarate aldolase
VSNATGTTKENVRGRIEYVGVIPSIRTASADDARFAAEVLMRAGLPIIEITMTVPGAVTVIRDLVRAAPDVVVGAGTVLSLETARAAVDAGAMFLTSPGLDAKVVEFAVKAGVLVFPGALTPTEVSTAWQAGADLVKIFPCGHVGGASYIRALRGPFHHVPFVAAGGVHQHNVADFIRAGVAAIDVAADLIPRRAIQERQAEWITELARRFLGLVKDARADATGRHEREHKSEAL